MQTILGISGPPRSGKDTLCSILGASLPGAAIRRLSAPLKTIALQFIPLSLRGGIEQRKDDSLNLLGTTYRDLQIGAWLLGRDLMGEDWLGHQLLDSIRYCHSPLILVPDFGRLAEAQVLIHAGHRVLQIKMQRPGTTFEGDSREDFLIPGPSNSMELANNGTLEELRKRTVMEITPWVEQASRPRTPHSEALTPSP